MQVSKGSGGASPHGSRVCALFLGIMDRAAMMFLFETDCVVTTEQNRPLSLEVIGTMCGPSETFPCQLVLNVLKYCIGILHEGRSQWDSIVLSMYTLYVGIYYG